MPGRGAVKLLLVAALLGSAGAALAADSPVIPGKGEGTVTVLAGARLVPMGTFLDDQTRAGFRPWKTVVSPGFLLALGYAPEADFHVTIDLGYGVDRIHMTPGTLQTRAVSILLGADTSFFKRSWMTLYAGGGVGYSLNTVSQNDVNVEANSSAGYICLGARFPLAPRLALVIEERYTLASAGLPTPGANNPLTYSGTEGSLNVGGNLLSIGLQFHYTDSDDKRPYHP